jgi:hypothetical protein
MVSPSAETSTDVETSPLRVSTDRRFEYTKPNVAEIERVFSVFLGSLLFARALRKFSPTDAVVAYAGYRLLHRGVTGQSLFSCARRLPQS